MARVKKDYRELTVSEATSYGRKTAPMLRIQGLWFQELGFNVGDPVKVKCENGQLIITLDRAREDMAEAERDFMEKETRKLKERFSNDKEKICAAFVAEREARYGA